MFTDNSNEISNTAKVSSQLACRGVRGATTVKENTKESILEATYDLLNTIILVNKIHPDDVASAYFTTTKDLNATYPAIAARQHGWYDVALICGHEMEVPDGLPMCVRVLIHWNTTLSAQEIVHVYLKEAKSLRPDRDDIPPVRPTQMSEVEAAVKMLQRNL